MTITTYSQLVASNVTSQQYLWSKPSVANQAASTQSSLWRSNGQPVTAAIPTTWATCTKATTGAWGFTNPGSGILSYLSRFTATGTLVGRVILYDRLAHMGGLVATSFVAQTVTGSIPANRGAAVDGSDVEWFCEIYTDVGTDVSATATVSYTRGSDDTAGRTSLAFGPVIAASPANRAGRLYKIIPIAGETIKSIQTLLLADDSVTAGNFGVTCAKAIASIPIGAANVEVGLDFAGTGLPRIYDDACLWLVAYNSSTSTGILSGSWVISQG